MGVVNKYKCTHCGAIVERESSKAWIRSFCDEKGKSVHLLRMKDDENNIADHGELPVMRKARKID